ncbi:ribosome maturation factor RimM [Brevibacterium album]|uniref:ribosome maturation factor RimM n=1 Tax=Brevibacterium album TaxID=417948 RepID=UPI0003FAF92E|nr:ribosome maturation factor RimM [Brevibacterium album]
MSQIAARTGRPHGIRGEVTVEVRTDDPDARFVPGAVFATEPDIGPLTLERARWHRDRLMLTFAEIADRTRAEEIRNTLLLVDDEDAGSEDDAWQVEELIGLAVHHAVEEAGPADGGPAEDDEPAYAAGELIGTVTDLTVGAVQDLLHIETTAGEEALVPFVEEIVPVVDTEARIVLLTPPPGLLPDGGADAEDRA